MTVVLGMSAIARKVKYNQRIGFTATAQGVVTGNLTAGGREGDGGIWQSNHGISLQYGGWGAKISVGLSRSIQTQIQKGMSS